MYVQAKEFNLCPDLLFTNYFKQMKNTLEEKIKQEGDYMAFEYKGYKCRILRVHRLQDPNSITIFLCGYVLLPKKHKYYGKDYDEIDIDVHGGLNYSDDCLFRQPEEGWWIGFDCGHAGDLITLEPSFIDSEYRDMEYVKNQLESLVDQLREENK